MDAQYLKDEWEFPNVKMGKRSKYQAKFKDETVVCGDSRADMVIISPFYSESLLNQIPFWLKKNVFLSHVLVFNDDLNKEKRHCKGWQSMGSNCYWIKKQITTFTCIPLYIGTGISAQSYSFSVSLVRWSFTIQLYKLTHKHFNSWIHNFYTTFLL